ncbi:CBS domain-containing protein [Roseomonas sp. NAR14]|uniref:CBS domain-containing protein n=1 Tax=Roseomonas acroporae TaxID=2937791 RepID=A0A9X2BTS1_9PROT|nr:CBS domain-containing protein [Roseomonas acroporae]MCK8784918.1 CBS domain-containing protein [Roseomonas acroporae]
MLVRDVMTRAVMTVPPETPVTALAALFAERGISGVPVVDEDGALAGMVTEGDLMRRLAAPGEAPRGWIFDLFRSAARQAAEFARTHGRTARDVMSTELATVAPEDSLEKVAALLEKRNIRRVPVVREGRLVGIVSRADLMRAVLAPPEAQAAAPSDREIHRRLREAMRQHPWSDSHFLFAEVENGVVRFHGFARSKEIERGLRVMAEALPGVREVRFDLARTPPFVID